MFGKETIWPTLMITTSTTTSPSTPLTKNASQTHTNPLVHLGICVRMAVFEVLKPSYRGPVDVQDDLLKTVSVAASSFGTECIFEFLEAFCPKTT